MAENKYFACRGRALKNVVQNERMILSEKGKTAFMVYYTHRLYLVQYNIYRYIC